jgi:putative ABC transport system ATP-binding protein
MKPPILEATGLCRRYDVGDGRIDALHDVSLALHSGEVAALAGPSGSGKSTLLNILALLDRPDAGTLAFEGRLLLPEDAAAVQHWRARHLGLVFQGGNLIPTLSALENVEMALLPLPGTRSERRDRAAAALARVGLSARLQHRPSQLSGGQQQRVGIARALCKQPAVVLADEPTASLDTTTALALMALMRELARESHTAFLVATHDARVLALADRRHRIEDGRLQADAGADGAQEASA